MKMLEEEAGYIFSELLQDEAFGRCSSCPTFDIPTRNERLKYAYANFEQMEEMPRDHPVRLFDLAQNNGNIRRK